MTYSLKFLPTALKEWRKLNPQLQQQFKKKLNERLHNPHVPASRLREINNGYKIKLHSAGYRLVYEVIDNELVILVISVGKREQNSVYHTAKKRRT